MKVKYIDRKKNSTLALIPGWASDTRVFNNLDLDYNYLLVDDYSPFTFEDDFLSFLRSSEKREKISLFGWSMGGFLAAEFAKENPGLVDKLFLVGIRKNYPKQGIGQIKEMLIKNKKGYLYKFYSQCFADKSQMEWFKNTLMKDYCSNFILEDLLEGLDYLAGVNLDISGLKRLKIVHGTSDKIAPIGEIMEIKNLHPNVEFNFHKGFGHLPFLEKGFTC